MFQGLVNKFYPCSKVIERTADKNNSKEWKTGHEGHSNTGRRDP